MINMDTISSPSPNRLKMRLLAMSGALAGVALTAACATEVDQPTEDTTEISAEAYSPSPEASPQESVNDNESLGIATGELPYAAVNECIETGDVAPECLQALESGTVEVAVTPVAGDNAISIINRVEEPWHISGGTNEGFTIAGTNESYCVAGEVQSWDMLESVAVSLEDGSIVDKLDWTCEEPRMPIQ